MSGASRFLVLEGIDGAGTTTQAARLGRTLEARGFTVHLTREPSDGPIGKHIRSLLAPGAGVAVRAETMALLFAADRLDHLAREVDAALARGAVVISDRYDLSSLAYQEAAAETSLPRPELVAWIRSLNRFARRPDLTLVLDVRPEVALSRRHGRGGEAELYEKEALQARLADIYARAEELVPGDRLRHCDGNRGADEIEAELAGVVLGWLAGGGSR